VSGLSPQKWIQLCNVRMQHEHVGAVIIVLTPDECLSWHFSMYSCPASSQERSAPWPSASYANVAHF
jgi:hypothetical protein